jgi:hypothetical protein
LLVEGDLIVLLFGALPGLSEIIPLLVFLGIVVGIWSVLSIISERNRRIEARVDRHSRPASLAEIEVPKPGGKNEALQGIADLAKAMSDPMMPKSELEHSALKVKLANAGFRNESARRSTPA